ncbi:MAG: lipopolysaccharide kinase InaA family protein [Syntrophorhabdales bacterium]|jgi:tRNA A-37 threonylcarbamoyl transferase component Bud32
MIRVRKKGISWFLDCHEGLADSLESVVGEVDARRGYAWAEFGSRKIFVKFFLERGLAGFVRNRVRPRGKKEYEFGKRILAGSVATPEPMGYGIGAGGSFVIQERIEGETFRSAFDTSPNRGPLLDALAQLLRNLADARIRHNDLHLENVLVSWGRLYLIDLHKAGVKRRFRRADELINLTQALTMVYNDMTEAERVRFFELAGRPDLRTDVEAGLRAQWRTWIDSKKNRAFSTTSKLVRKGSRVYVRGREEEGRGSFLALLKNDRKVRVERYSDHVRKIYRGRRRLVRAWENWAALEYVTLDIVPRPFFVERPSFLRRGYVAMEDLAGRGEELDRLLDRRYDSMDTGQRRVFIGSLARFLGQLLGTGIVQNDLKACNVFVLGEGFRLLDVEDIGFYAPTEDDVARMLVQLNNSVPSRIRASDRIRFFLHLTRPFPWDGKRIFRRVAEACAGAEVVYEGVSGLKKE